MFVEKLGFYLSLMVFSNRKCRAEAFAWLFTNVKWVTFGECNVFSWLSFIYICSLPVNWSMVLVFL